MVKPYTSAQMMVTTASREIRDGEVVFVGMRLPLLAFMLAKHTHAPRALGLFENGVFRDSPARGPIVTMGDSPNQTGAVMLAGLAEVMTLLSGGGVDLGFIGGAQVDVFGNVNTHLVNKPGGGVTRLPGSGGGADIACLAGRLLLIMNHERRRLVPRVDYITSPGHGDGPGWRRSLGLTGGGPAALITSLGVFRFPEGRAVLTEIYPGVEMDRVARETGWELVTGGPPRVVEPPSEMEIEIIKRYDPLGFWGG